ncbi:hypothetical protein DEO72_LG1g1700 [Vigna unguiculata]|uniref:Uncharacterized protein n=1 Tax=Vigna unguiculata TaxID=3917 RepID=A0A4D6KU75_VIGUN|nr:hypothetical protein DEO72_LG1g1700 [Vigna unguiculata]
MELFEWQRRNDTIAASAYQSCIRVALCSLTVGNGVSLSHALEILQIELAILADFLSLLQLLFVLRYLQGIA